MKRKKPIWLPRRNIPGNLPRWCIFVTIDSPGNGSFSHEIYFRASWGGSAKVKALPKLQSFLERAMSGCSGSPKVAVWLKCIHENGNGNGTPVYALKARYSYYNSIISARKPSQVFKTVVD